MQNSIVFPTKETTTALLFCISVASRHSAEKRNPESNHKVNNFYNIDWIPLFSGMTDYPQTNWNK